MSSLLERYLQFYFTVISLLLIVTTGIAQNEHLMPSFCTSKRPKRGSDGCVTERRWVVHAEKGCKPYAYCEDQLQQLDAKTGINYFTSEESCQRNCTQHIVCPEPPAPENGNVTIKNGFSSWGGEAVYSCNEGYSLEGEEQRECLRSATWTNSVPICQKQCPQPPPVNHSMIAPVRNFHNKGTRIFYTCAEGYSSTVSERTCESGGVWSGPEPVCQSLQKRFCPEPDLIHNGIFYAPNREVGDTITYSCNPGFIIIGNATRTCGNDERWQGDAPVCWKLNLEYIIEDDTNRERMDITNRTLSLPAGTENVWIITGSSHPDPLQDSIPVWFFNDDVLREMEHPHGVEQHQQKLKFPRILKSKEQEGNYTIMIGGYSVSFHLAVEGELPTPAPETVIGPVVVAITPANIQSNVGGQAEFVCVLTGCPSPNVTWFHNDSVVQPGGRVEYEVSVTSHSITFCHLTISNVSEADIGLYKCVGNNPGGSDMSGYADLVLDTVQDSESQRRKRSADETEQESSSLCKQSSEPESVTLVATASKELRRPRSSRQLRNYRFEVKKILKGQLASSSLSARNKRSLRAIVLDSYKDQTASTTHLLASDTKYILSGRMIDNVFYIIGPQSIHQYSKQLEAHIQSC